MFHVCFVLQVVEDELIQNHMQTIVEVSYVLVDTPLLVATPILGGHTLFTVPYMIVTECTCRWKTLEWFIC